MNINFAPADDAFLEEQVKNGIYSNKTEAVRDAVRRLREQQEMKLERFLSAVRKGEEDLAAGRIVSYTPDYLRRKTEEAIARADRGEVSPLNPEVTGEGI